MYTDIHLHACAWGGYSLTLDDVARWMKQHDVSRGIVLEHERTRPRSQEEQRRLVQAFARFRGKIDYYCNVPFDASTRTAELIRMLSDWKKAGAIGYGEHYFGNDYCDALPHMRLYEACAAVGFPILFHLGETEQGLPHLENAVRTHPLCMFIAHAPGWWNHMPTGDCERLLQYPNLFADLSAGSGAKAITRDPDLGRNFLIRNADKVFFGTDAIFWTDKEPGAPPQFSLFKELGLPPHVQDKIFHKNAARKLLHIEGEKE